MATVTMKEKVITPSNKKRINVDELSQIIRRGIDESIGDMVITVFVTAATLIYIFMNVHPSLLHTAPGFYIAGMIVQLMIRVVQRFDEDYTVGELGRQLTRMEDEINNRMDNIIQNMMPY